mmetsp:Transcript_10604/g.25927  ORF Transcript_10604/g.25927 Transcript_10604/m.25927 type:complete len:231 (-) Transcript_10604:491-1183(-)
MDSARYRRLRKRVNFFLTSILSYLRIGRRSGRCCLYGGLLLGLIAVGHWLGVGSLGLPSHIIPGLSGPEGSVDGGRDFSTPASRLSAWNAYLRERDLRFVEIMAHMGATRAPRCLDVERGGSPAMLDGRKVQIWRCSRAPNQRWALFHDGSIRSMEASKQYCLDFDQDTIRMTHCSQHITKWRYNEDTEQISLASDHKCLHSPKNEDGDLLTLAECETSPVSPKQRFKLI